MYTSITQKYLVVCIFEQKKLPLVEVLHALFPPHEFYHLAEGFTCVFTTEQEPPAALEEHSQILDIRAGKVVEADLEHVENDVCGDNAEFREISKECDIAHPDFGQLLHDVLLALQVSELFIQLDDTL